MRARELGAAAWTKMGLVGIAWQDQMKDSLLGKIHLTPLNFPSTSGPGVRARELGAAAWTKMGLVGIAWQDQMKDSLLGKIHLTPLNSNQTQSHPSVAQPASKLAPIRPILEAHSAIQAVP